MKTFIATIVPAGDAKLFDMPPWRRFLMFSGLCFTAVDAEDAAAFFVDYCRRLYGVELVAGEYAIEDR